MLYFNTISFNLSLINKIDQSTSHNSTVGVNISKLSLKTIPFLQISIKFDFIFFKVHKNKKTEPVFYLFSIINISNHIKIPSYILDVYFLYMALSKSEKINFFRRFPLTGKYTLALMNFNPCILHPF